MVSFASAVCTVNFDKTLYTSGETVIATMSCDSPAEKSQSYTLTWRDVDTATVKETVI